MSGKEIDALWQLEDVLHRTPQWLTYYVGAADQDVDSDDDEPVRTVAFKSSKGNKKSGGTKKPLAITNGSAEDSDSSMPSLQTVSDSSEDDVDYDDDDSADDEDDDYETDSESTYDTDEEDALRDMLREAMDTALTTPDFFDPKSTATEFDALAEERKSNPFLKLLGSLRGACLPWVDAYIGQFSYA